MGKLRRLFSRQPAPTPGSDEWFRAKGCYLADEQHWELHNGKFYLMGPSWTCWGL